MSAAAAPVGDRSRRLVVKTHLTKSRFVAFAVTNQSLEHRTTHSFVLFVCHCIQLLCHP